LVVGRTNPDHHFAGAVLALSGLAREESFGMGGETAMFGSEPFSGPVMSWEPFFGGPSSRLSNADADQFVAFDMERGAIASLAASIPVR
jgi:hypothetical protein